MLALKGRKMAIGIRRILHSLGEHQVQGFGSMTSARVTALILAFQSAVMGSLEPTDDELSVLIERSRIAQSLSVDRTTFVDGRSLSF